MSPRATGRSRTIGLNEIRDADEASVGAKAAALARMARLGLPVPEDFSVVAQAYAEHLRDNALVADVEAAAKSAPAASSDETRQVLSNLRAAIRRMPPSDELRAEIELRHRELGGGPVAVRSSATSEDLPGHSFAGQHGTYFVSGVDDCVRAVKDCWASLWTERAFDYRARNGFDQTDAQMSVIVQRLVPADAAGVVFTADPLTGASDRITIEACFGLGETLVSGKVTPDRIVLDKNDSDIVQRQVSRKQVRLVPARAAGGAGPDDDYVREQAAPPDRANLPCIDDATAKRLGKLAVKVERAFGSPQDIEWAMRSGDVFLLQSRPITTISAPAESAPRAKAWEDRQVWSNLNTAEVLPDVMTPFTWSLLEPLGQALCEAIFGQMGMNFIEHPLFGQIAGRAYFSLNTAAAALRSFPGTRTMNVNQVLGGEQGRMFDAGTLHIPEEDIPDLGVSRLKAALRMPAFVYWLLSHSPKRAEELAVHIRARADELLKTHTSSLSDDELTEMIRASAGEVRGYLDAIAFAGIGMYYFDAFAKLCARWLDDEHTTVPNRLISGVGGMDSAEAGLAMWRLADVAHSSPQVEAVINEGQALETTRHTLATAAGGNEFLAAWDAFMAEHGHHTRGELELVNPRWSETPDYVLGAVRGYLDTLGQTDPAAHCETTAQERDRLLGECHERLRYRWRRRRFDRYCERAKRGSVTRENLKSVLVRYWTFMRFGLLDLGGRLTERAVLTNADDIFFLRLDEIRPVVHGEAGFDVRETISRRRQEYERNLTIMPPKVIVGRFDPDTCVPDIVDEDAKALEGLAVSPGVVTGPARVILRSDEGEQVLPGEILVAPFTDPGWTPYFIPAAGIVMDMGGLLSHGSIVAREYGIPAVVNVGPATKIIKTGQAIQVDGDHGVVRIL